MTRPFSQAFKEAILSLYEKLGYKDWELELVRKMPECADVTCAAARAAADKRIDQARKSEPGTQVAEHGRERPREARRSGVQRRKALVGGRGDKEEGGSSGARREPSAASLAPFSLWP